VFLNSLNFANTNNSTTNQNEQTKKLRIYFFTIFTIPQPSFSHADLHFIPTITPEFHSFPDSKHNVHIGTAYSKNYHRSDAYVSLNGNAYRILHESGICGHCYPQILLYERPCLKVLAALSFCQKLTIRLPNHTYPCQISAQAIFDKRTEFIMTSKKKCESHPF
jgi:hypothetical protein